MDQPRVKRSSIAGKGLFASKDLPLGAVALSRKRPLIVALDTKRLPDTCTYCLRWAALSKLEDRGSNEKVTMKACTACKTVRYCSKVLTQGVSTGEGARTMLIISQKCQSEDWTRLHNVECKVYRKISGKGTLPNAARAVMQMMLTTQNWETSPYKDMESHLSEIMESQNQERIEQLLVLSTGLHHYSGGMHPIELIQNLMAIVSVRLEKRADTRH